MKRSFRCLFAGLALAVCSAFCFSLVSCNDNPHNEPRLYIDDCFSWAMGSYEDTIEDAQRLQYTKLERMGYKNIKGIPAGCLAIYVLHNYVREICAYVKLNLRILLTGQPKSLSGYPSTSSGTARQ